MGLRDKSRDNSKDIINEFSQNSKDQSRQDGSMLLSSAGRFLILYNRENQSSIVKNYSKQNQ